MMTRTTIRIRQELLDKLKQRALKSRISLTQEIGDLLTFAIYKLEQPRPKVELPILVREDAPPPLVDLTKTSDLLEMDEDYDSYRRQRSS